MKVVNCSRASIHEFIHKTLSSMPLVVFVGIPSCGKSKWAHKLAEFLRAENKVVHIVREEELIRGDKNEVLDGMESLFLQIFYALFGSRLNLIRFEKGKGT